MNEDEKRAEFAAAIRNERMNPTSREERRHRTRLAEREQYNAVRELVAPQFDALVEANRQLKDGANPLSERMELVDTRKDELRDAANAKSSQIGISAPAFNHVVEDIINEAAALAKRGQQGGRG